MNNIKLLLVAVTFLNLAGCKTNTAIQSSLPKPGMFKVAILYPNGDGKTFDMDYYENKHMPMMAGIIGKNLQLYEIDKGISGRTSNDKAPFVAIGYFYVADIAEYNKVIGQNIAAIRKDIEQYTNIQPTIQISELRRFQQGAK